MTKFRAAAFLAAGAVALALLSAPSISAPEATTYQVDGVHSGMLFRVVHLGVSAFYGRFNRISGNFTVDDGGTGSVSIEIDAASVDTGTAKRDDHLRSPDFFSVKQFPTITFKGDLKKVDGNRYASTGKLTLHGVTKEIEVRLERIGTAHAMGGERTGFEGTFTIKRGEYGMTWNPDAVSDEVRCIVAIEGIHK